MGALRPHGDDSTSTSAATQRLAERLINMGRTAPARRAVAKQSAFVMKGNAAVRRPLTLVSVGLVSVSVLLGCGGSAPVPPLTAALDRVFVEYGFNGSALVARDAKTLLDKGYGLADHNRRVPNGPDTIFQIA